MKEFESVFRKNYKRLCVYAFRFLESEEEAEDVVADAMETLWKMFDTVEKERADALFYSIVRNRCLNLLEHRKAAANYNRYLAAAYDDIAEAPDDYEELVKSVEEECGHMSDRTRSVLRLCYYENRSYKEVADRMGVTTDAVKKHIVKALKTLREKFNPKKR